MIWLDVKGWDIQVDRDGDLALWEGGERYVDIVFDEFSAVVETHGESKVADIKQLTSFLLRLFSDVDHREAFKLLEDAL